MLKWASIAGIAGAIMAAAGLAVTGTEAEQISLVAFLTMAHFCFSYVLGQYAQERPEYAPSGWLFLGGSAVAAVGLFTRIAALGAGGLAGAGASMATFSHLALIGGGMLAVLGWVWILVMTVPRWLQNDAPAH